MIPSRSLPGSFALRLFAVSCGLLSAAALLAVLLSRAFGFPAANTGRFEFPAAFLFSTGFLVLTSAALQRAVTAVRRERQQRFRRALFAAIACGTGFVGVQGYGLWCIVRSLAGDRNVGEAQLGPAALVLGAAGLHAVHVTVALLFLVYVTLRGVRDRYDHEYWFGVSVCAWFWHFLGTVWIFILGGYVIVSSFLAIRLPSG